MIRNGHAPDDNEYVQKGRICDSAVYSGFLKWVSEGPLLFWRPKFLKIKVGSHWLGMS